MELGLDDVSVAAAAVHGEARRENSPVEILPGVERPRHAHACVMVVEGRPKHRRAPVLLRQHVADAPLERDQAVVQQSAPEVGLLDARRPRQFGRARDLHLVGLVDAAESRKVHPSAHLHDVAGLGAVSAGGHPHVQPLMRQVLRLEDHEGVRLQSRDVADDSDDRVVFRQPVRRCVERIPDLGCFASDTAGAECQRNGKEPGHEVCHGRILP